MKQKKKSMNIGYGEIDIFYPIKFETKLSYDELVSVIEKSGIILTNEIVDNKLEAVELPLGEKERLYNRIENFEMEDKKAQEYYGNIFMESRQRFLLLPLRAEICNGKWVWLFATLYIFKNAMGILRLELPLLDVDSELLKNNDLDAYIKKLCYFDNNNFLKISTFEEVKELYLASIYQKCRLSFIAFGAAMLPHIILIDFEGCPYNVKKIEVDVQEELFRIVSAPVADAPYTTYADEAKEYVNANTWGTHNIRCIIKTTGGCLSFIDKTVQEFWIEQHRKITKSKMTRDEYVDMGMQFVREVHWGTEFPLVILILKRMNLLDDIYKKSILDDLKGEKKKRYARQLKYEHLQNNVFISMMQEECCGTISEQCAEFERLMPYYTLKELTGAKQEALNEILKEKELEKQERFQNFISIGSLMLSFVFGLPGIRETVSVLRSMCIWCKSDIPHVSINGISFGIWIFLNVAILFGIRNSHKK